MIQLHLSKQNYYMNLFFKNILTTCTVHVKISANVKQFFFRNVKILWKYFVLKMCCLILEEKYNYIMYIFLRNKMSSYFFKSISLT